MPAAVGTPAKLFGKNDGGEETGVGRKDGREHEIVDNFYLQLDFTALKNALNITKAQIKIGSVQPDQDR